MDKNEKLIGKLIEKRKAENEAFTKLLDAIEQQQQTPATSKRSKNDNQKN